MSLGIGETLRNARRRVGCSLADAAADTRVRESYLAALEREDFAGLGGDVYVKGFISSYARYLSLDPSPLLDAYRTHREQAEGRNPGRGGMGAVPGAEIHRERPAGAAILLILLLVIVAALLFFTLRDGGGSVALAAALGTAHVG